MPDIGGKVRKLAVVASSVDDFIMFMRSESGQDAVEIGFSSIDEITYLGDPSCWFMEISIWYGQTTWPSFEQKKNVATGHQMPLGLPGVVGKFTQHK